MDVVIDWLDRSAVVFRHAGRKAVEDGFFGFNKKGELQNIEKNMEDLF